MRPSSSHGRGGTLLIVVASLLWSTTGVAIKLVYERADISPLALGFLRLIISSPALLVLSWLIVGKPFLKFQRQDWTVMLLTGAAVAGYQVVYFSSIQYIGVAPAVLINICSSPIWVAMLAAIFLRERLTHIVLISLIGAIAGTALLVGGIPEQNDKMMLLIGINLALVAGLTYAVIVVCGRGMSRRYQPIQPLAVSFSIGALFLLPVFLLEWRVPSMSSQAWSLVMYIALVPTTLAYALYFAGLRTTSATVTAILTLLEPFGATILATTFLGEQLSLRAFVGAMILLASIALLYLREPAEAIEAEATATH